MMNHYSLSSFMLSLHPAFSSSTVCLYMGTWVFFFFFFLHIFYFKFVEFLHVCITNYVHIINAFHKFEKFQFIIFTDLFFCSIIFVSVLLGLCNVYYSMHIDIPDGVPQNSKDFLILFQVFYFVIFRFGNLFDLSSRLQILSL